MWAFDRLPGSLVYFLGVSLCCDETSASESCASHARQSTCCPQGSVAQSCPTVLQCPKERLCPHLWGTSQLPTSGESAHQPAQDLLEAKSSREHPPLALIRPQTSPLQVASCWWLPNVPWPGPCSRKHLAPLTALSVINQLSFSPAFLVIKVLRAGGAPKNWVPSARVLHPSLLPKLLVSSTSL